MLGSASTGKALANISASYVGGIRPSSRGDLSARHPSAPESPLPRPSSFVSPTHTDPKRAPQRASCGLLEVLPQELLIGDRGRRDGGDVHLLTI